MFFLKQDPETPKEAFNWRLYYGIFAFAILGFARSLDESLIGTSASQPSFQRRFGLDDPSLSDAQKADLLGNIVAMVQVGSIAGALMGFYITDKIGRLWAVREMCILLVIGFVIFLSAGVNGSLGMVYAGRFTAGMGIGQSVLVGPIYLAETSLKHMRGFSVCMFAGSAYLGVVLGYFASLRSIIMALKLTSSTIVPNLLNIYVAIIIFALSFGAIESPRWLMKVGRYTQATENLCKIRGLPAEHPFVRTELHAIQAQLERELEASSSLFASFKDLFVKPANRYRLWLSVGSQLLSTWSGASSITIYAPQYFAILGKTGQDEKLLATGILGIVKFCSSMLCTIVLVDYFGRKRALLSGITLQFIAMLYIAIFLVVDPSVSTKGSVQSSSQKSAATGAIAMIYVSGFGWALGWNSLQYVINSEIYPLHLRAIGGSLAMTLHFANQYGNSRALPSMFLALSTAGTMFFFAAITVVGLVWAWFFLPELAGQSLEAIDAVFELPWHQIGRRGKSVGNSHDYLVEQWNEEKEAVDRVEYAK
ncbi:hypothetical protein M409DRAFT_18459 [Zasmidium cellare ATCC 36951]|uniref:Major facilitator superfamily (MFS) profile domain-containing protein n=1 Tax=Zasmidium cellare ATCC 36951 TaxID=1080233 RepID=A0A6A6CZM8_ZASCE|nr:uncharacterized protein M409DRAFT_18459 [Zasmidium cellare ATCC 36951]KAF2171342.1 hypothetical protein M409DRAFT_18459 [Zasmidium cellare ATCC 36951]